MIASPPRRARSGFVAGSFLAAVATAGAVHAWTDVDYPYLTNTRRSYVDFNVEVVRGFVFRTSPSFECFSVNAYESTIVRHTSLSGAPASRWPTLTNPVSIAFHGSDLLVVGQGNHALARHDSATGAMTDVIMLGSEPSDIVVDDETDMAYVSCMGDDSVWEIDLGGASFAIGQVWNQDSSPALPAKRPRFLNLDKGGSGTSDNVVYVAPLVSGNNTLTTRRQTLLPKGVHDGNNSSLFDYDATIDGYGLPDVDLFRITPSSGAVDPVLRGVGSLITAHAINPSTGDYWMLGVQEHNLGVGLSEPALRGMFATNSLAITTSLPSSAPPAGPSTLIDLDDTGTTPQYQTAKSCAFPYALDIRSDGQAVIGSATSPVVKVVDSAGAHLRFLQLADPMSIQGRVVRTVKYHGTNVLAYCQQTSNIVVFSLSPLSLLPASEMSLGNDPTPEPVRLGREIWYDATRSLDGRTSCNTCHPQGGSDGLVWQIGDVPVDDKGPLVTQPLLGIEDTFPYHWRGERTLSDFNGAFPGLLGASSALNSTELANFEEFVFSLRPHANFRQDRDRMVKDGLVTEAQGVGIIGSPIQGYPSNGLALFENEPIDGTGTCVRCHQLPTGSNGEFMPDHADPISARANFEAAHLNNQLALKHQPIVQVELAGTASTLTSNLLGSGNSASGVNTNLFDFVNFFFLGNAFGSSPITAQDISDIVAFLKLFDSGTAPSVHWAVRYDQASESSNRLPIRNQLLAQSADGWVGVVARGVYPVGSTPTIESVNWYYDPTILRFVPDRTSFGSGTLGNQTWTQFQNATIAGYADNVFFGVPPGNERRLGADMDSDGLNYGAELSAGSDPWDPDSDADGYPDGYEVANSASPTNAGSTPTETTGPTMSGFAIDFETAKVAKLFFRTNEPAKWTITLTASGYPTVTDERLTYDTIHSAVVQGLAPSPNQSALTPVGPPIDYDWSLVLTDLRGNTTTITNTGASLPDVTSGDIVLNVARVVGALSLSNESRTGGTYSATVDIRLDEYDGDSPANPFDGWRPVLQVLKRVPGTANDWELIPSADFSITSTDTFDDFLIDVGGTPSSYSTSILPGPYLVLPATAGGGLSTGDFVVTGLNTGQEVLVNVIVAFQDSATPPATPYYAASLFARFVNPAIPTALRNVQSSL